MRFWKVFVVVFLALGALTIYGRGFATFKQVGNVVTITEANETDVTEFYNTYIAPKVAAQVAEILAGYVPSIPAGGMEPNEVTLLIAAAENRMWQRMTESADAKIREFETTRLTAAIAVLGSRLNELGL